MPLINGRVTKNLFNNIITKMDNKLNVWYNKYLSLAGRTVLINSNLQNIPYYAMAAFNLPQGIKQGIQCKMKKYLWHSSKGLKQIAKTSWNLVSSPKIQGALGIKNIYLMNRAFQMKIIWKLLNEPNSLFTKLIQTKYYPHSSPA